MDSTNTRNDGSTNTSVPSLVGDRSISLASLEKKKLKETNEYTVSLPTYIITCVFLISLCVFLISVLVFIGHSLLHDNNLSSRLGRNINLGPLNNSVIIKALALSNNSDNNLGIDSKYKFDEKQISLIKKFKINDSQQQNTKSEVKHPLLYDSPSSSSSSATSAVTVNDNNSRSPKLITMKNLTAKFNVKLSKIIDQLTYRLPSEIKPKLYNLYLHPNLNDNTYSGNVQIRLEVNTPVSFIPVHAKKLTIISTKLFRLVEGQSGQNGSDEVVQSVNIKQAFDYPPYEYWVTEVDKNLEKGNYLLDLEFNGSLTDRIVGFYGSTYLDKHSNRTRLSF